MVAPSVERHWFVDGLTICQHSIQTQSWVLRRVLEQGFLIWSERDFPVLLKVALIMSPKMNVESETGKRSATNIETVKSLLVKISHQGKLIRSWRQKNGSVTAMCCREARDGHGRGCHWPSMTDVYVTWFLCTWLVMPEMHQHVSTLISMNNKGK